MLEKPQLKTYLTIFPLTAEEWAIRGGNGEFWSIKLHDERALKALGAVLPCLGGRHDRSAILAETAKSGVDAAITEKLLDKLESLSLLEESGSNGLTPEDEVRFREQIAYFSRYGREGGARLQGKLRSSRLAVAAPGPFAESLCRLASASGFGTVTLLPAGDAPPHRESAPDGRAFATEVVALDRTTILPVEHLEPLPSAVVVAHTAHDPVLMEAMDVFSKQHGVPWLLVRAVTQSEGWVGPLFVPGDTASYVSFEARLRGNMGGYEYYQAFDEHVRQSEARPADAGGLVAFCETLSSIAVAEVIKLVTGMVVPVLAGRFLSINWDTLETELHEVLRMPRIENRSYSRPGAFPWKEVAFSGKQTRRA